MEAPRLPICIQGDALYATEPMMELCREKNLEEMIGAGRGRWKIENEGFNSQKNGI